MIFMCVRPFCLKSMSIIRLLTTKDLFANLHDNVLPFFLKQFPKTLKTMLGNFFKQIFNKKIF